MIQLLKIPLNVTGSQYGHSSPPPYILTTHRFHVKTISGLVRGKF